MQKCGLIHINLIIIDMTLLGLLLNWFRPNGYSKKKWTPKTVNTFCDWFNRCTICVRGLLCLFDVLCSGMLLCFITIKFISQFFKVEENEAVVQYALNKRNVKIVPMGIDVGLDGYTKYSTILKVYSICTDYGL